MANCFNCIHRRLDGDCAVRDTRVDCHDECPDYVREGINDWARADLAAIRASRQAKIDLTAATKEEEDRIGIT